jgi:hypothetical protein
MDFPLTDVKSKLRGKLVKKLYMTKRNIYPAFAALMQDKSDTRWKMW